MFRSDYPTRTAPAPSPSPLVRLATHFVLWCSEVTTPLEQHRPPSPFARTLGVAESTVRGDLAAGNPAPADSELTVVEATSSADPPPDGETADRENTEETDETAAGNPATHFVLWCSEVTTTLEQHRAGVDRRSAGKRTAYRRQADAILAGDRTKAHAVVVIA